MAAAPLSLFPPPSPHGEKPPVLRLNTSGDRHRRSRSHGKQSTLIEAAAYDMSDSPFDVKDNQDISPMLLKTPASPLAQQHKKIDSTLKTNNSYRVRQTTPPVEPISPHFSTPHRVASHRLRRSSGSIHGYEATRGTPLSFKVGSSRSGTPAKADSPVQEQYDSPMLAQLESPVRTQPMRSMFPQLQPGIPLSQQPYAPVTYPAAVADTEEQFHAGRAPTLATLKIKVPERHMEPGSIQPPASTRSESLRIRKLADGERGGVNPCKARLEAKIGISGRTTYDSYRPTLALSFADASGTNVYEARVDLDTATADVPTAAEIRLRRCNLSGQSTSLVAHMKCTIGAEDGTITTVFPHIAAVNSISIAAGSFQARMIAQHDPTGESAAAAQLMTDAVQSARTAEESTLICRAASLVSPSATAETYELHHRTAGPLQISVEGRLDLFDFCSISTSSHSKQRRSSTSAPRGRVALHSPFDNGDSGCTTTELAWLDVVNERLELDLEALCGDFESLYMIDTAVCTLVAVVVAESLRALSMRGAGVGFAGMTPLLPETPRRAQLKRNRRLDGEEWCATPTSGRTVLTKARNREVVMEESEASGEKDKYPFTARVIIKVVRLGFKIVVWLLGAVISVLARVLSCMTGVGGEKGR